MIFKLDYLILLLKSILAYYWFILLLIINNLLKPANDIFKLSNYFKKKKW